MFDLKKFRNEHRIRQIEISRLFDCTQSNISLIENGIRDITPSQYNLLVKTYGEDIVSKYIVPDAATLFSNNEISSSNSNVNYGNGNNIAPNLELLNVIQSMQQQMDKLIEQQDKLINIITSLQNAK